jgi:hypothetical protein
MTNHRHSSSFSVVLYANRSPRSRAFLLLRLLLLLLLLLLLPSGASVLQIHHLPGTLDVGKGRFLLPFTPLASTLRTLPQSRAVLFAAVWQEQASSERPDDFNRCIVRARLVI